MKTCWLLHRHINYSKTKFYCCWCFCNGPDDQSFHLYIVQLECNCWIEVVVFFTFKHSIVITIIICIKYKVYIQIKCTGVYSLYRHKYILCIIFVPVFNITLVDNWFECKRELLLIFLFVLFLFAVWRHT